MILSFHLESKISVSLMIVLSFSAVTASIRAVI